MADDGDFDEYGADDSNKSERKRQREKQRRSDIASAFDELSSLLSQIDPEDTEVVPNRRRRRKAGEVAEVDADTSGLTRLDLIGRTAEVLRKLKRENEDLRKQLEEQQIYRRNIDQKQEESVEDKVSPFYQKFARH
jgi:Helix-loop-helix DNA-binding domain